MDQREIEKLTEEIRSLMDKETLAFNMQVSREQIVGQIINLMHEMTLWGVIVSFLQLVIIILGVIALFHFW